MPASDKPGEALARAERAEKALAEAMLVIERLNKLGVKWLNAQETRQMQDNDNARRDLERSPDGGNACTGRDGLNPSAAPPFAASAARPTETDLQDDFQRALRAPASSDRPSKAAVEALTRYWTSSEHGSGLDQAPPGKGQWLKREDVLALFDTASAIRATNGTGLSANESAVIAAAVQLAPLLEEGWDDQDTPEDQNEGAKACDALMAAVNAMLATSERTGP